MSIDKLVCFDAIYHKPVGTHLNKTWANSGVLNIDDSKLPYNPIGLSKNFALIDVVGKSEIHSGNKCDFFFMTYPDWSFYDLFSRSKNKDTHIVIELWSFVPTMISAVPNCYKIENNKLSNAPINFFEFTKIESTSENLQSIKFKVCNNYIKDLFCRGVYINVNSSYDINLTIKSVYFNFSGKI
jgi:hypothetical protein